MIHIKILELEQNGLEPQQNGCQYEDSLFKCSFKEVSGFWLEFHKRLFMVHINTKICNFLNSNLIGWDAKVSWWLQGLCFSASLMLPGGFLKNTYELLNQRVLKFSYVNKIHIFQCMGKIFCVEFQRYPLKFHTKYLTHTLKDTVFIQHWNFKSS